MSPWPVKVRGAPTAHKVVLVSASTTIMRVKLKNPRRRSEENKVHDSFGRLTKIVTVEVGRCPAQYLEQMFCPCSICHKTQHHQPAPACRLGHSTS